MWNGMIQGHDRDDHIHIAQKRPDFKGTLCSKHVHARPVYILVGMRKI